MARTTERLGEQATRALARPDEGQRPRDDPSPHPANNVAGWSLDRSAFQAINAEEPVTLRERRGAHQVATESLGLIRRGQGRELFAGEDFTFVRDRFYSRGATDMGPGKRNLPNDWI